MNFFAIFLVINWVTKVILNVFQDFLYLFHILKEFITSFILINQFSF